MAKVSIEKIEEEAKYWKKFFNGKLEDLDIKIILIMREDGRISDTELAKLLNTSISTVSRRRKALMEKGYLKVVGLLILQEVGLAYADVLIEVAEDCSSDEVEEFINEMSKFPQVYEIVQYFGKPEILLRVFEKDTKSLSRFIRDTLKDKQIVKSYKILPVIRTPKAFDQPLTEYVHYDSHYM